MKRMIILILTMLLLYAASAAAETAQTGFTKPVPESYLTSSDHPGTVEALTYDSMDYVRDEGTIQKTAYVYLPYSYDANDMETRYNVLYLMHGWGGHAGEYFEFAQAKNIFDHLIENGDIEPIIIVSASFYNENSDRDFSSSIEEFRQFHRDFDRCGHGRLCFLLPGLRQMERG